MYHYRAMPEDAHSDRIIRVEFRLLGSLEVAVNNETFDFGSARQRIILAMLLLQANQVVPLAQLVDAVWDEKPPATAESQVQTCISALRQRIEKYGSQRLIVTRSIGYAIMVPDDGLDYARFEHLVRRGRAAASDRRLEDAVRDLRAALALWRGPAVAGVESRPVQASAARLNESRLLVLEECIDLELVLGRHHDLAVELGELVAQHPLRERLRAQHMLALYRSARQAEALESFQEVRHRLVEELGIDPGEELTALEEAILRNDPALELKTQTRGLPERADHSTGEVPHQLPAALADFTGRDSVLGNLVALLSPLEGEETSEPRFLPVVTLAGKGGVGKTTLAVYAAHAVRQHYPDGQLFAQLRDPDGKPISSQELLARFLRALGMQSPAQPSTLAERTAAYRSLLGERRVLIILDDADSLNQVQPLIPGSPTCAVIITNRYPFAVAGAAHFEIGDVDEQTAVSLLARILGAARVEAEPAAALALVRLCGCLPLALRIVAAKLAMRPHWRIDQMVHRMANEGSRLDELALSGAGIRATLSLSYNTLPDNARRLFLLLGQLGTSDFASWVCAPLLDVDPQTASELLDKLVEVHLVEVRAREGDPPRFRLHDLVRIYAVERLAIEEPAAARTAALKRVLGCWLSLVTEAHRRRYGGNFTVLHGNAEHWTLPAEFVDNLLGKTLSWFRDEHLALISAIQQAAQAGLDELCWDLAMTSVTFFEAEYLIDHWRKTHEAALEVTRRNGNLRGEAAILCSLGNLAVGERLGDAERHLNPALRTFDKLGDTHGSALTLGLLAFVDRLSGRYEEALARYQSAMDGFLKVGDLVGQVDALTSMAQIEMDREQFDLAERHLREALTICKSLNSPRIGVQTEYRMGEFLLLKGELEGAERCFKNVLGVSDETDVVGKAYALQGLGVVYTKQERFALAETDLRTALELARRVGDNLVHGRVLLACAEYYFAKTQLSTANAMIDEALVVFSSLGPATVWRARFLELKARIDEKSGRVAAAEAARRIALELAGDLSPALFRTLSQALAQTPATGPADF
jgi:DNA-binding SARP family transcriptional activator/tetratricopeptide (TPR) repeat protein